MWSKMYGDTFKKLLHNSLSLHMNFGYVNFNVVVIVGCAPADLLIPPNGN